MTLSQLRAIYRISKRTPCTSTFRALYALAQPTIGCDGAVILPWAGMWLCIERDGYTHS